jgi:hypothetical protein
MIPIEFSRPLHQFSKTFLFVCAILFCAFCLRLHAGNPQPLTFCNPLNLDYGPCGNKGARHGADPVIVLFKDKYYLFDTWDKIGYRVSDDLANWNLIPFDKETSALALTKTGGDYGITAPAAFTDGKYLYFANFGGKNLLRTEDPSTGHWELALNIDGAGDPDLFLDDDGRLYMISGLGVCDLWEIDRSTGKQVKDSRFTPIPRYKTVEAFLTANLPYGLFYGHNIYRKLDWNKQESLDTAALNLSGTDTGIPTFEGNWMTKYKNRYYLSDGNPDTSCPWYTDSVWEANNIKGPYKLTDYSPGSMKVGGFINSAGHSCVFQDRYGNWWRVTTMWIGAFTGFERRIGLFPAGFDDKDRMYTETGLGDYPVIIPNGPWNPQKTSPLAGWWVLSTGKTCTASSTLDAKHEPSLAGDENVRTWWSAKTGDKGEWFQMDLGKTCTVNAVQVNFAEQDCDNKAVDEDYLAYQLLVSQDGKEWTSAIDKSANKTAIPHDYVAFPSPLQARYLKVLNMHSAKLGKFALRDLRVFGNGGGSPPPQVPSLEVTRGNPA